MTTEEQTLLMFKGLAASLSEGRLVKYKAAEQKIRDVLAEYPEGEGVLAIGLICAEMQINEN